jgi:xanthine dehydrogenase accessory factor
MEGGSARAPGAQMAVLEDGRFAGYLSGGCLETIIASEAVRLIGERRDDILRFGVGSPFIDVRLPCGSSIDLHVHVDPDPALLAAARSRLSARQPFAIDYFPERHGDTCRCASRRAARRLARAAVPASLLTADAPAPRWTRA